MNFILILSLFSIIFHENVAFKFGRLLAPEVESLDGVEINWIRQILDHFNTTSVSYWNQRFLVNTAAWKRADNSPVFLFVSGENPASPNWMKGGSWVTWAYKYGALLLQLEHRFYGQSQPTPDTSVRNLQYLSSKQAIQDVSYFIKLMNEQYNLTSNNKWILFGGSYAGNLVAWAKLKLPNQVYGAVSSSGPLMAELDFYQFLNVVRDSLETISPGCASTLTSAVKSMQRTMRTSDGIKTIFNKFNVCSGYDPTNQLDLSLFYVSATFSVTWSAQYNGQVPGRSISDVCTSLNNQNYTNPVDRLAALSKTTNGNSCLSISYSESVAFLRNTNWQDEVNSIAGGRPWIYQTCAEFGYFTTSNRTSSLLSNTIPLEWFTQRCQDIFGINKNNISSNVDATNRYYHGTDIRVDRVIFVQGSIDPWHALGRVNNPTKSSPFIYINGGSHGQDMLPDKPSDSSALKGARKLIDGYLATWLT